MRTELPQAVGSGLGLGWALAAGLIVGTLTSAARAQNPEDLVASGHVRIRASMQPEAVLVGQRSQLTVEVMTKTWFLAAPDFPSTLEIPDAVIPSLGSFGVNSTERIGSDTFAIQARTYEIFPVAPGRLAIPEIEVTVIVATDAGSRSEPTLLATPPSTLEASVPEAARGLGLVVATPRLTAEESWSRALGGLRVGDALTRTVTQTVESSIPMVLAAPILEAEDGVRVYPERPSFDRTTDRGEFSGSRTDTVSYVLEAEGSFELPEVVISWWDLEAGRLRQEVLPAAILDVAADPELAAEHLAAPVDLDDAGDEAAAEAEDGFPWRLPLAAGALLLVMLAARRPFGRLVGRLMTRPPADPERTAWSGLRRALSRRESAAVLAALYTWRDSLEGLPGPPTLESLAALADDPQLSLELGALQNAVAGVAGDDWHPSELARRLETGRGRWQRGPSRLHEQPLGPLNPRPLEFLKRHL